MPTATATLSKTVSETPSAAHGSNPLRITELPLERIVPNSAQPRVIFDESELTRLAQSIRENGILQPVTVRRTERGYQLIAGERRLRAARIAGLKTVPCIVKTVSDGDAAVLAVLENLQRADLNYLEEAYALRNLICHYGYSQEQLAAKLGTSQSALSNKLRLLRMLDEEKSACLQLRLSERQARTVLRVPAGERRAVIEDIAALGLSAAGTEMYVTEYLHKSAVAQTAKPAPPAQVIHSPRHAAAPPIIAPPDSREQPYALCLNVFNRAIETMRRAGIECTENKTAGYVEYVVRIPDTRAGVHRNSV